MIKTKKIEILSLRRISIFFNISYNKIFYNGWSISIEVIASADGGVDYYGVQVWKGSTVVYQKEFTGHTVSFSSNELGSGEYSVFVSCVNPFGNIVTDTIHFIVNSGLKGDVNQDNKVTSDDVLMCLQHASGENRTDLAEQYGDMNNDGTITTIDALLVLSEVIK